MNQIDALQSKLNWAGTKVGSESWASATDKPRPLVFASGHDVSSSEVVAPFLP